VRRVWLSLTAAELEIPHDGGSERTLMGSTAAPERLLYPQTSRSHLFDAHVNPGSKALPAGRHTIPGQRPST